MGISFQALIEADASLALLSPPEWGQDILGISGIDLPEAHTIVFIKGEKYLKRLGRFLEKKTDHFPLLGAILDKKFWELLKSEEQEKLCQRFGFVAKTDNIDLCMSLVSKLFYDLKWEGVNTLVDGRQLGTVDLHPTAYISQNVFIGEHVTIGPNVQIHPGSVVLSYSKVGEGSVLFPNVTIYPFVSIGKHCRIHSGTVIGADGFGYTFQGGVHQKLWHMGGVILQDNVEIGALSAVDGGTFGPTIVGLGTKVDNMVQIGHNCRVGKGVILCGQSALSGSCVIGDYTVFGGKAGVGQDIEIGGGSEIAGNAMVTGSWPDRVQLGGHPARPLQEWIKGVAYLRKESLKGAKK